MNLLGTSIDRFSRVSFLGVKNVRSGRVNFLGAGNSIIGFRGSRLLTSIFKAFS